MKQQAAIVIATLAIGAALAAILVMRKTSVRSESEPATRRLLSSWITNLSKSNRRGAKSSPTLCVVAAGLNAPNPVTGPIWEFPYRLATSFFCQRELQGSAEFSQ